ncbi:MAG: hypothetical protein AAGG07_01710 [Planctomycetota bacterium]
MYVRNACAIGASLLFLAPVAQAGFDTDTLFLSMDANTGGSQSRFSEETRYRFFPGMSLTEFGGGGTAFRATLSSPTGLFESYENDPDGVTNSSVLRGSTEEVVGEVNGEWTLTLDDEKGGVFDYLVRIEFTLPFDELPSIQSTSLVNGASMGPLDWEIVGGDSEYPGPNAEMSVQVRDGNFGFIENDLLSISDTEWTPGVDPTSEDEFIVSLSTRNSALDTDSLTILSIEALDEFAPEIALSGSGTVSYNASLQAILIPAPASVALLSCGVLTATRRRRG